MRKLSQFLNELEYNPGFDNKVSFHIFINDPKEDEPLCQTFFLSDEELARSNSQDMVESLLRAHTLNAIEKWRSDNYGSE